jgi:hypothetical protein
LNSTKTPTSYRFAVYLLLGPFIWCDTVQKRGSRRSVAMSPNRTSRSFRLIQIDKYRVSQAIAGYLTPLCPRDKMDCSTAWDLFARRVCYTVWASRSGWCTVGPGGRCFCDWRERLLHRWGCFLFGRLSHEARTLSHSGDGDSGFLPVAATCLGTLEFDGNGAGV